jgi:hypothetical protein
MRSAKKIKKEPYFAECHSSALGKKNKKPILSSANSRHSAKKYFF